MLAMVVAGCWLLVLAKDRALNARPFGERLEF